MLYKYNLQFETFFDENTYISVNIYVTDVKFGILVPLWI